MTRCLDPHRMGFASVGKNVIIRSWVEILNPERVSIGSHVMIDDFVFIGTQEELIIGNHVHLSAHSSIIGGGNCYLSDFVSVSVGSRIITGTDDPMENGLLNSTIPPALRKVRRGAVWLGAHAGLAANVTVYPDVAIGEGAIVSGGGVVHRSLAPWGIYGGNPLRKIKDRPHDQIAAAEEALAELEGELTPTYRAPCYQQLRTTLPTIDA